MPKQYAPEFRQRIVDLARSGKRISDLIVEYEISQATIYRWIDQDRVDHGEKLGPTSAQNAELTAARKRIRDLEQDLEVVRRAAAIFDKENDVRPKGSTR